MLSKFDELKEVRSTRTVTAKEYQKQVSKKWKKLRCLHKLKKAFKKFKPIR